MPSENIPGLRIAVKMALSLASTHHHERDLVGEAALQNMVKLFGARIRQESNDPTTEVPVIAVCAKCGGPSVCVNCGGPV